MLKNITIEKLSEICDTGCWSAEQVAEALRIPVTGTLNLKTVLPLCERNEAVREAIRESIRSNPDEWDTNAGDLARASWGGDGAIQAYIRNQPAQAAPAARATAPGAGGEEMVEVTIRVSKADFARLVGAR